MPWPPFGNDLHSTSRADAGLTGMTVTVRLPEKKWKKSRKRVSLWEPSVCRALFLFRGWGYEISGRDYEPKYGGGLAGHCFSQSKSDES